MTVTCGQPGYEAQRTEEAALIDALTYASYRYNRVNAPKIAPERWRAVFVEADALEARYQAERAGERLVRETFSGHGFGD